MARRGLCLVYGGGSVGLMGELADSALGHGGRVIGVIPKSLWAREINHTGLTELHEVGSMHERKRLMYDKSDAFIALPGGLGTLEELAEVATWSQLGLHSKPFALLDVDGFWEPLVALLDRMEFAVRARQTFDGDDVLPTRSMGQDGARIVGHIVNQDGARAAFRAIAAQLRAG